MSAIDSFIQNVIVRKFTSLNNIKGDRISVSRSELPEDILKQIEEHEKLVKELYYGKHN